MIPYVTKHNSTSFKPKGLIIDGQEKKLSAEALVKIDVFGIGELVIRDNGINYKFGTKKLTGIRYNDQVYAYDEDLVRKIVRTYTNGSCYYCKRPVPITARNIVGLRKPMFILSCPYCQGLSQLWIERDRIKPVVIVKPTAVVEVETQYGIKYNVFPGSFKVLGDDEMQFYAHIISDHPPSTSPKKYFRYTVKAESLKRVRFHSGKELDFSSDEDNKKETAEKETFKTINPNDVDSLITTAYTKYHVLDVTSVNSGHFYFNAYKPTSVDGKVFKVNLPIRSIESVIVGETFYKMSCVKFEVVPK